MNKKSYKNQARNVASGKNKLYKQSGGGIKGPVAFGGASNSKMHARPETLPAAGNYHPSNPNSIATKLDAPKYNIDRPQYG